MRNGEQPPHEGGWGSDEEETTSTGKLRLLRGTPAPVPTDLHEAMGKLMAAVARLETKARDLETLPREFAQLRKDVEQDRTFLVRRAARRSSNRLALLVSGLFVLYDQAAPILHAIWKGFHR
jgi:hypothetical protein